MSSIRNLTRSLLRDENGGEVLEYALIAGLIVIAAIAVIGAVGTNPPLGHPAGCLGFVPVSGNGLDRGAAGRVCRRAASLVGHDADSIAPSSLLALRQTRLRHDRCRMRVQTPGG